MKGVTTMPNERKSFNEIVTMILNACNHSFYSGTKDIKSTVVECATQIYIAQMGSDNNAE